MRPCHLQALTQPLLLRHLCFKGMRNLTAFTEYITREKHAKDRDLGVFARRLTLESSNETYSIDLDTTGAFRLELWSLLQLLPYLEVFHHEYGLMTYDHMLSLVQTSGNYLRDLHVRLASGSSCETSLMLIGQLRHLRRLHICTPSEDEDSSQVLFSHALPLTLDHLREFTWETEGSTLPWVTLLSRSHFPSLERLRFCLCFIWAHINEFSQFFTRHPRIQVLCLDVFRGNLDGLLSLPISAHTISFTDRMPPASDVWLGLPTSVRTLIVPIHSAAYRDDVEIFEFLEETLSQVTPPGLQEIRLSGSFRWETFARAGFADEETAHLYANVLHFATVLATRGIRVTDDHGTSATIQLTTAQ
jgi:hypothetical protein